MSHRDVVHQRDRPGPHAEQIVDVHRDAVDADRVVTLHLLRQEKLRADTVGRDGESDLRRERHDVGEIAERQQGPRRMERKGLGDPAPQRPETVLDAARVHSDRVIR